ncbi:MAG: class I SAM-dependent methyltransferase, partial [Phycisphaerae bacterium]|nr:class I SAM-dependent methyltransferase [Phycisphaerae bacterium]
SDLYDPFQDEHSARPSGTFNLILCFEVLEHVPDPTGTLQDICSFLDDDSGLILFSTVLTPADIDRVKVGWWYIAPRNGHVSIYSRKSLGTVLRKCGLHLASASQGLHFAFRQVPEFAKHILKAKK